MTKDKKNINDLVLLDMDDVCNLTKWGKETTRNTFAHDDEFPAIKKGKKYLVELEALRKYFSKRRV